MVRPPVAGHTRAAHPPSEERGAGQPFYIRNMEIVRPRRALVKREGGGSGPGGPPPPGTYRPVIRWRSSRQPISWARSSSQSLSRKVRKLSRTVSSRAAPNPGFSSWHFRRL